ncbi:Ig-like domain-containing protein [Furfurilactobacillus rossiae]|uniref:Bacterial Ig domain-containing protein n=1 Tax=Furfurilactobacillus rossiae DSM 15814 TaxID=1114972 RepID=A0A0R1RG67_9LACO|nr:Ig-like domain-containing protein [Furfurilactobacillus rossiae]KRL55782.1 hypothetical protein FD35_GL002313 [Furfurilactobacillus rossiae DSM 15814]QFR67269.1 hypothetical protein LR814_09210 [Furfurilactobacillus rossiae]QLE60194.1 surface adhesion protein putative [Furfurilactobacillus rossiae]
MRKWQQTLTRFIMVGLLLVVSVPSTISSVGVQADTSSPAMSSANESTRAHEDMDARASVESAPFSESQRAGTDERNDDTTQRPANAESENVNAKTDEEQQKQAEARLNDDGISTQLVTRLDTATLIQNGQTVRGNNDLLGVLGGLTVSLNDVVKATVSILTGDWTTDIGTPMKTGDKITVINRALGLIPLYTENQTVVDPGMSVTQVNAGSLPGNVTYDKRTGTMPAIFGQSLQLSANVAFNYTTADQVNSVSFMIDGQQIAGDAFTSADTVISGKTLTVNTAKIAARNWTAIKTALNGLSGGSTHTLQVVAYHNGRPINPWMSANSISLYVNPDKPVINDVWSGQRRLSGTALPAGSTIKVTDSSNNVLGTGAVADGGTYTVGLNRAVAIGETITVTVTSQGMNETATTVVKQNQAVQVTNAPKFVWNQQASTADTNDFWQLTASGAGFPSASNATELVIDGNNLGADNPITRGATASVGSTTGVNPATKVTTLNGLDPQQTHKMMLTIPGMNDAVTDTVPIVIAVPTPHSVIAGDGATTLTGKLAQPGSRVTVKDNSGMTLGTGTVTAGGTYQVTLNRAVVGGETLTISATNGSGGTSATETLNVPQMEQLSIQSVSPLNFSPAMIKTGTTLAPPRAYDFAVSIVNSLNGGAGANWTLSATLVNNELVSTTDPTHKLAQPLIFTDANGVKTPLSTSSLPIFTNNSSNVTIYPTSQFRRTGMTDTATQQTLNRGMGLSVKSDAVFAESYQGILNLSLTTGPNK